MACQASACQAQGFDLSSTTLYLSMGCQIACLRQVYMPCAWQENSTPLQEPVQHFIEKQPSLAHLHGTREPIYGEPYI